MPSPTPQDGLPRPNNVNKMKKSHQMNTRYGKTPSPTIEANDGSWPTPAEAAAAVSVPSHSNNNKRLSPKKSPKMSPIKNPIKNMKTSPTVFTPSKSRMLQEPRSAVSEERIRQKMSTAMARFEEAKQFMDDINGSSPSLSNLSEDAFLNEVVSNGIPLRILVDNVMKRMHITPKVEAEAIVSVGNNHLARQNALYFMSSCTELGVGDDVLLSTTDVLHGKLSPIVNNILAIQDIYINRNKSLDNFKEGCKEGAAPIINPLWGAFDQVGEEDDVEVPNEVPVDVKEDPTTEKEEINIEIKEEESAIVQEVEKVEEEAETIEKEAKKTDETPPKTLKQLEEESLVRKQMFAQQAEEYEETKLKREQELLEQKKKVIDQAETTMKCLNHLSINNFKKDIALELGNCANDVGNIMAKLCKATRIHEKRTKDTEDNLRKETAERKRLFNELQVIKGNIRVLVRVRPSKEDETVIATRLTKEGDLQVDLEANMSEEQKAKALATGRTNLPKVYEFDHVFGSNSTQTDVFKEVCPLVTSVMDGWHASILAYGQTGSGKTYTMEGVPGSEGVNVRALHELFRIKEEKESSGIENVEVTLTMVEIYNEQVKDLLSINGTSTNCEIKLKPVAEGGGVFLPTATTMVVQGIPDVEDAMARGKANRSTGSTKANEHSSRSHSVLMVEAKVVNIATGLSTVGRLSLVDLAGSERIAKTGATGTTLKEAQAINKSLSALGNVISSLKAKQGGDGKTAGHVPYRDSKLTYLLQESLGADNKTLVVVQVSPEACDVQETNCSVAFGSRARNVELGNANLSGSGITKSGNAKNNATKQLQAETLLVKANKEKTILETKNYEIEKKLKTLEKQFEEIKQKEKNTNAALKASNVELSLLLEKEKKATLKAQVLATKKKESSLTSKQLDQLDNLESENAKLKKQLLDMKKKKEIEENKVAKYEKEAKKKTKNMNLKQNEISDKVTAAPKPSLIEEKEENEEDVIVVAETQENRELTFAEVISSPPKQQILSISDDENLSPVSVQATAGKVRKVSFISPIRSPLVNRQTESNSHFCSMNSTDQNQIQQPKSFEEPKSFRKTPCKEKPSLQAATASSMRSSMSKTSSLNGPTRVSVVETKTKGISKGPMRVVAQSSGASRRASVSASGRWH